MSLFQIAGFIPLVSKVLYGVLPGFAGIYIGKALRFRLKFAGCEQSIACSEISDLAHRIHLIGLPEQGVVLFRPNLGAVSVLIINVFNGIARRMCCGVHTAKYIVGIGGLIIITFYSFNSRSKPEQVVVNIGSLVQFVLYALQCANPAGCFIVSPLCCAFEFGLGEHAAKDVVGIAAYLILRRNLLNQLAKRIVLICCSPVIRILQHTALAAAVVLDIYCCLRLVHYPGGF